MSVDCYLCICCLSTDDLISISDKNKENDHTNLLKELFKISLPPNDDYICMECIDRLKEAYKFRTQVLKSVDTLQVIGLINIKKINNGELLIEKVHSLSERESTQDGNIESKKEIETKTITECKDIKSNPELTPDQLKNNQLGNIEIADSSNIIRSFLANDPLVKLERDGYISAVPTQHDSFVTTKDLKCKICLKKLPNLYVFNTHMNKHLPNYICEICGKGFATEKKLKRHRYCHNTGPFLCQYCNKEFHNYSTLDSHRKRKHTSAPLFKCTECPSRFHTIYQRARHQYNEHDTALEYKCDQCEASFRFSASINAHNKYKHQKLKRFLCDACDAGFYNEMELIGHTALHSGQNAFRCELCSKSYPRKKALIVHLKTHANDKRFCCHICGRRFIQKCTLNSHIKVHNRVKKDKHVKVEIISDCKNK